MKFEKTNQHGFTLIEILIALSILVLLVGGGVANYYRLNQRKQAEEAARTAEAAIRFTQKQATSGVKPIDVACNSPRTLNSYQLSMNGNNYSIIANCSNGDVSVRTNVQLPNNAIYVGSPTITFNLNGEVIGAETTNVCVQNAGGNFTFHIQVLRGGSIAFVGLVAGCP